MSSEKDKQNNKDKKKIIHEKQRSSPIEIPSIISPTQQYYEVDVEIEYDHLVSTPAQDHTRKTGSSGNNFDTVDSLAYEDRRNSVFDPQQLEFPASPPAGAVVMQGIKSDSPRLYISAGELLMEYEFLELRCDKEITLIDHIGAIYVEEQQQTKEVEEEIPTDDLNKQEDTRSVKHFIKSISHPAYLSEDEDQVDAGGEAGDAWDEKENHAVPLTPTTSFHQLEKEYRYSMNHAQRGCFIIFNQKYFDPKLRMEVREGTDLDANSMFQAAQALGFEYIKVVPDATKKQIQDFLQKISDADHTNYDCFGCAILTHGGDNDVLYAKDDTLHVKDFTSPFGADRCESLAGKPKIFFIQACRGFKKDPGHRLTHVSSDMVDGSPSLRLASGDMVDSAITELKVPVEADFLIAHSTAPDYYAWRNKGTGSVYIQDLCKMFEFDGQRKEMMQMLTRVNRMVAYDFESNVSDSAWNKMKQIPSVCTRLTAELYFESKRAFQSAETTQQASPETRVRQESIPYRTSSTTNITMTDKTSSLANTPSTSYKNITEAKSPQTKFLEKSGENRFQKYRKQSFPNVGLSQSYESPPTLPPKLHPSASQPNQISQLRAKNQPSNSHQRNSLPPDFTRTVYSPDLFVENRKVNPKYNETDI